MFFNVGLQSGWLIFSVITEFITFGCALALTIVLWLVWYVPGLLALIGTVFFAYSFCVSVYYAYKLSRIRVKNWDTLDAIVSFVKTRTDKYEAYSGPNGAAVAQSTKKATILEVHEDAEMLKKEVSGRAKYGSNTPKSNAMGFRV
jgi:hypothetical protein